MAGKRDVPLAPGAGGDGVLMHFRFPSDPELLRVVRQAMEALGGVLGMTPPECRSLILAVDEALTNIIRHAYGCRKGKPIEIYCRQVPRRSPAARRAALEVLLVDHGCAVPPSRLRRRPRNDRLRCGGLGLHLIGACMDVVEFRRRAGANRLRLVKYFQPRNTSRQG